MPRGDISSFCPGEASIRRSGGGFPPDPRLLISGMRGTEGNKKPCGGFLPSHGIPSIDSFVKFCFVKFCFLKRRFLSGVYKTRGNRTDR